MAYRVCSPRERERLVQYESAAYRIQECRICFEDGTRKVGKMFVWDGDLAGLREGDFDLRDCLLRKKEFTV
jgi:hypothetical protein